MSTLLVFYIITSIPVLGLFVFSVLLLGEIIKGRIRWP
jgi:hypothetical protein